MSALQRLIATTDRLTPTVLRVVLGAVMIPHGAQKLFGWFGGFGLEGTLGYFHDAWGIPAAIAILVPVAEFFGGIGLVLGALSRVAAGGIAAVMIGAVALQHAQNGFFMNWTGNQGGEGWEYHLLALALATGVVLMGSGRWSVDRVVARSLPSPT